MFWQLLPLLAHININRNASVIQHKLTHGIPKIFYHLKILVELLRLVYFTVAEQHCHIAMKGTCYNYDVDCAWVNHCHFLPTRHKNDHRHTITLNET